MYETKHWEIIFFMSERGDRPVFLFIDQLNQATVSRIFQYVDLLQKNGPNLGMPYTRKMSRRLYELRVTGKIEVRIFYTYQDSNIYLLHAFRKQSQKTPKRDLRLAEQRARLIHS